MEKIMLSREQAKILARGIYADIKQYCEGNFERFFAAYLEERNNSNGRPIEPITIRLSASRFDREQKASKNGINLTITRYFANCY